MSGLSDDAQQYLDFLKTTGDIRADAPSTILGMPVVYDGLNIETEVGAVKIGSGRAYLYSPDDPLLLDDFVRAYTPAQKEPTSMDAKAASLCIALAQSSAIDVRADLLEHALNDEQPLPGIVLCLLYLANGAQCVELQRGGGEITESYFAILIDGDEQARAETAAAAWYRYYQILQDPGSSTLLSRNNFAQVCDVLLGRGFRDFGVTCTALSTSAVMYCASVTGKAYRTDGEQYFGYATTPVLALIRAEIRALLAERGVVAPAAKRLLIADETDADDLSTLKL